jgi:hypothetical protein
VSTPLLLHSLTEHRTVIFGCLEAIGARTVVEVGSEFGGFTTELTDWMRERGGRTTAIEPYPVDEVRALDASEAHFTLVEGLSPAALREVEPADAYVLDGDHTYWTVRSELRTVRELAGERPHPLVVLHDVGWPCGRRDQYYDPSTLPEGAVHPHTWDQGVVPGDSGVVDGGFRGEGQFAAALHEGGPENGVLTAVEDHLAEHPDLAYAHVPSVFGLGIVYPSTGEAAERLRTLLAPYDRNPQLERLEQNRIELFLRVLELQDALQATQAKAARDARSKARLLLEYSDRLAAAEAENAALRLERVQWRARPA